MAKKYLATNKLYYFLTPNYFGLNELSSYDRVLYADNKVVKIYHYDSSNYTHSIITCNDWLMNTINTNINIGNSLYTPLYVINSHRPSMTYKTSKWCSIAGTKGICVLDVTKL